MGQRICPNCKSKFWVDMKDYCTICGYYLDYIPYMREWTPKQMKESIREIKLRSCMCNVMNKGETKKGLLANCTLTNRGMRFEFIEKFERGLLSTKKWKFKQPPVMLIPYDEILSITPGQTNRGEPARYFDYETQNNGAFQPWFFADMTISDKFPKIDEEIRDMVEAFRKA